MLRLRSSSSGHKALMHERETERSISFYEHVFKYSGTGLVLKSADYGRKTELFVDFIFDMPTYHNKTNKCYVFKLHVLKCVV